MFLVKHGGNAIEFATKFSYFRTHGGIVRLNRMGNGPRLGTRERWVV